MKNKEIDEKKQKLNRIIFFFGALVVISAMITVFYLSDKQETTNICEKITGTPVWVDKDGKIIEYGYKECWDDLCYLDVVNNYLIPEEITFVYHDGCSWCHEQIDFFGDSWNDYIVRGLVIEC